MCFTSQIAKFMGPTWGPPGSCRPQMGPMLAPRIVQSGFFPGALLFLSTQTNFVENWDVQANHPKAMQYCESKFNEYRKLLNKILQEATSSYYLLSFTENHINIRRTWGVINEIISKNKNSSNEWLKSDKWVTVLKNVYYFVIIIGPNRVWNPNKGFQTNLKKHCFISI